MSNARKSSVGSSASDLAVMGVDEIKQKRRLTRIMDARDGVAEVAKEARERYIAGQIQRHGYNTTVSTAVKDYIREVHNLLYGSENDLAGISYPDTAGKDELIGRIEMVDRPDVLLRTLREYYNCDNMIVEEVERDVPRRHGPDQVDTEEVQHSIPLEASWRAYILVNLYIGESAGLQMQTEQLETDEHADPF